MHAFNVPKMNLLLWFAMCTEITTAVQLSSNAELGGKNKKKSAEATRKRKGSFNLFREVATAMVELLLQTASERTATYCSKGCICAPRGSCSRKGNSVWHMALLAIPLKIQKIVVFSDAYILCAKSRIVQIFIFSNNSFK